MRHRLPLRDLDEITRIRSVQKLDAEIRVKSSRQNLETRRGEQLRAQDALDNIRASWRSVIEDSLLGPTQAMPWLQACTHQSRKVEVARQDVIMANEICARAEDAMHRAIRNCEVAESLKRAARRKLENRRDENALHDARERCSARRKIS